MKYISDRDASQQINETQLDVFNTRSNTEMTDKNKEPKICLKVALSQSQNVSINDNRHSISIHNPMETDTSARVAVPFPTKSDDFREKIRRQVCRFYIGSINKQSSSELSMRHYLEKRCIQVPHLLRKNRLNASAQLDIDAQCEQIIRDPAFLPDGIYMKDWLPCSLFISEKNVN